MTLTLPRIVEPELLDALRPQDPLAVGSRRDLRRLNSWMGNAQAMAKVLNTTAREQPRRLVELGAGDGTFLYRVVRQLPGAWEGTRALLLDRQPAVTPETTRKFARLGWRVETVTADVFDWLRRGQVDRGDTLVANLFLHHFGNEQVAEVFRHASRHATRLVAIEPRRSGWALAASRLVGLIGCNGVTRHDAPVSVRAGFRRQELSDLWPGNGEWAVEERRVGWFSHLFVARRTDAEYRP